MYADRERQIRVFDAVRIADIGGKQRLRHDGDVVVTLVGAVDDGQLGGADVAGVIDRRRLRGWSFAIRWPSWPPTAR